MDVFYDLLDREIVGCDFGTDTEDFSLVQTGMHIAPENRVQWVGFRVYLCPLEDIRTTLE